ACPAARAQTAPRATARPVRDRRRPGSRTGSCSSHASCIALRCRTAVVLFRRTRRSGHGREQVMALMDFIKKQFIDIIEWTETVDGTLAWRFPVADREIQYGASLTVRESQMAVFVNEGMVADVFGPGRYTLDTNTLPILTYLQNWDKLFQSPFKSDVYFFSTRQQIDQRWGTTQPVTIRDKDFGAVR